MTEREPPRNGTDEGTGRRRSIPETGRTIIQTIDALQHQPQLVHQAVREKLHTGGEDPTLGLVRMRIGQRIDRNRASATIPKWMDLNGVFSIANELMAPDIWLRWIRETKPPSILSPEDTEIEDTSVATTITLNNAQFYTTAVSLGLLAAAAGRDVVHCLPQREADEEEQLTSFGATAIAIGARFDQPANESETYLNRVQTLLPDPDQPSREEFTFLHYLDAFAAFDDVRKGTHCPARLLTKHIFDEWGRSLRTDAQYMERFKRTVTRAT